MYAPYELFTDKVSIQNKLFSTLIQHNPNVPFITQYFPGV